MPISTACPHCHQLGLTVGSQDIVVEVVEVYGLEVLVVSCMPLKSFRTLCLIAADVLYARASHY